jgi:hypothetical protein
VSGGDLIHQRPPSRPLGPTEILAVAHALSFFNRRLCQHRANAKIAYYR